MKKNVTIAIHEEKLSALEMYLPQRRGRRSHSGRQSRPHFGIFEDLLSGSCRCPKMALRGRSAENPQNFGKTTGVGGEFP